MRYLKTFGFMVVAAFTISAVMAAAVFGQEGQLTADGPFYLTGTDEPEGNALTYPGLEPITCSESHYEGLQLNSTEPISSGSSDITVAPAYTNCLSNSLPTTITMNGCDFVFHVGKAIVEEKEYELTVDLECGEEGPVQVEAYSGKAEALKLCTITFGTQTALAGLTIEEAATDTLLVSGTLTGVTSSTKEGLCGHGGASEASLDINLMLSGEGKGGGTTHVGFKPRESAQFTADGPFYLVGEDEESGNALTYPGEGPLVCPGSQYVLEAVGSSGPNSSGVSAVTVTPTYKNCQTGSLPVTIFLNGCDYVLYLGETTGGKESYELATSIDCPEGQEIEQITYSGASEGLKLCTIKYKAQVGLVGAMFSETGTNAARMSGTIGGISASRSGLCGASETTEAQRDVSIALQGYDAEEGETEVIVSD